MRRATKMCSGCPFRGKISKREKIDLAAIPDDWFPCHEEAGYSTTDIQCRGHWELRRKAAKNLGVAAVVTPEVTRGGPRGRDMVVRPVNRKVWDLGQRCSVTWNTTDAVTPRRQGKNQHASAATPKTFELSSEQERS